MSRSLALLVCAVLGYGGCSARSAPSVDRSARADTAPAAAAEPAAAAPAPPPDPREARLAAGVVALLENHHLRKHRIDDNLSREAWKTYLERLDGNKMFLLKEDATALGRHADRIDDQLHSGSLELAHDGQARFVARVAVVEKMVAELLAVPLDLSNDEYFEVDPEKVELAASDAELRDRWRRRLELEVLERVTGMEDRLERRARRLKEGHAPSPPVPSAGDLPPGVLPDEDTDDPAAATGPGAIPATPEAREAKARADLAVAYAGRFARLKTPRPLNAAATLINAVAATYDPHTDYLPPSDKANFDIQMSGALEGIGARLRERDHYIEVAEIVPGGASWRQGRLTVGDLILSVANVGGAPVDVADMPIDDVVKMIRGPKGTVVTLRIRKASGEEETLAITRDTVVIEEAYARGALLTPSGGKKSYGYIYLPSFYGGQGAERNAAGDVRRLLSQLAQQKVAGVIIDVRSNGGGLLNAAIDITGELIDEGPVVQVQDSRGRREVLGDDDAGTTYDGPVVVMIDRFSASASEIVAGALKDYRRAVIVGTGPTHGKGTVQSVADLDRLTGSETALNQNELGAMKITVQQFFRVNGASTQLKGVPPDILLPDAMGFLETGERELEHAIPFSQVEAVPFTPARGGLGLDALVARSAARVAKEPLFAKISQRSQILRAWRDDTQAPLSRTAFEARQKDHRAKLEATALELDKAPPRFGVKLVEDPRARLVAPGPNGKVDDRPARWRDQLSRDPWVGESLAVLSDLAQSRR
jgi:carboxyl-terminal processing protease